MQPPASRPAAGTTDHSRHTLGTRPGLRPVVVGPQPHAQQSQTAPVPLQQELLERALALPWVRLAPSAVSVPGARAFVLDDQAPAGPAEAFQAGREFAHLHPPADGSLHMTLPAPLRRLAFDAGWGEPHPMSGTPLIFGPRDRAELEVIWYLLQMSYRGATGELSSPPDDPTSGGSSRAAAVPNTEPTGDPSPEAAS